MTEQFNSEVFFHQPHLFKCAIVGHTVIVPVQCIQYKCICVTFEDEILLAKFPSNVLTRLS